MRRRRCSAGSARGCSPMRPAIWSRSATRATTSVKASPRSSSGGSQCGKAAKTRYLPRGLCADRWSDRPSRGSSGRAPMTPLAGILGMCAVFTLVYLFLSARAITIWSGPRLGPKWAMFFAQFDPYETTKPIPRRTAIVYAVIAAAFETVLASGGLYLAVRPPSQLLDTALIAVQIAGALAWTVYFLRLPRQTPTRSGAADRGRRG